MPSVPIDQWRTELYVHAEQSSNGCYAYSQSLHLDGSTEREMVGVLIACRVSVLAKAYISGTLERRYKNCLQPYLCSSWRDSRMRLSHHRNSSSCSSYAQARKRRCASMCTELIMILAYNLATGRKYKPGYMMRSLTSRKTTSRNEERLSMRDACREPRPSFKVRWVLAV